MTDYHAVLDDEILFTFEALTPTGADWIALVLVETEMHKCHHDDWHKRGQVVRADNYREVPGPNEAAVRY